MQAAVETQGGGMHNEGTPGLVRGRPAWQQHTKKFVYIKRMIILLPLCLHPLPG